MTMQVRDVSLLAPPGEPAERWAGCPVPWNAKVSPDGSWVAWAWAGLDVAADVYVVPTDGTVPPRRLTATPEHTIVRSWAPDSRSLIIAENIGGDERDQLFRLHLDRPNLLEPLTEKSPNCFIYGGQLDPSGRWLIYSANLDADSGEEIQGSWIYRHDLASGTRTPILKRRRGEHIGPQLNRAGTLVLCHRHDRHPAGSQAWLIGVDGGNPREILNLGDDRKVVATWHADGRHILFLAEEPTHQRVGLLDPDSGSLRWLVDDPQRFVEGALPADDGRSVMLIEVEKARLRASLLDLASGEETPVRAASGSLIPIAGLPGGDWIGYHYGSTQPADLVRFTPREDGPARPASLSRVWERTPVPRTAFAPAEDFRWISTDGLPIQGWLYRARRPVAGTVVWIHGGPTWHSEDEVNTLVQYMVGQGFNVLDPNYRGSTGNGVAFREAIKEDGWGGREQDDIRTGIQALIAAGIAEPGRIGVCGVSYGGYSSWCAITAWPRELVAAAAPICGMTDLSADYEATELPHGRLYSEEMMGGAPHEEAELYRQRSPIHFVANISGKLLIVHGLRDPNVTPVNTELACAALDAAGIPYELLTFDNEGHGIWKRDNRRLLFGRLAQFFAAAFDADAE
jgi:dipeptidyl aminopeptidase/acylaminoacyl peptidase